MSTTKRILLTIPLGIMFLLVSAAALAYGSYAITPLTASAPSIFDSLRNRYICFGCLVMCILMALFFGFCLTSLWGKEKPATELQQYRTEIF